MGKAFFNPGEECGDGEEGGDQEGNPSGDGFQTQPKGEPGQGHHQEGRHEGLNQMVTDLTGKLKLHHQLSHLPVAI